MSLLDRDPTPEDLEAERDLPRPGVWAGEDGADLRALTQDETDALVRSELFRGAGSEDVTGVLAAIGGLVSSAAWDSGLPLVQRGGIDSDPLVRVLARRAWGDRDRQWFELRGVRKGDELSSIGGFRFVHVSWSGENVVGIADADARPGEDVQWSNAFIAPVSVRVDDRLRAAQSVEIRARHGLAWVYQRDPIPFEV